MSVLGPNGPRVLSDRCSSCIFRAGNPMRLRAGRVREMVRESLKGGGFITCHSTLPYGQYPDFGEAICRGFYDSHGPNSQVIRSWSRLGPFDEVEPPTSEAKR